jgi:hypothetical protein
MASISVPPPGTDRVLSTEGSKPAYESKTVGVSHNGFERTSSDEDSIDLHKEIYDTSVIDPVLAKKMALTNNAIDEIGMTPWQWKLFCLNGFGYAVDSVRLIEDSPGAKGPTLIRSLL